jgi:hypothetical protein
MCFVRLKHRLHSSYEKSIVESAIEYLNDRIETFDDYYPCMRSGLLLCNLLHVFRIILSAFDICAYSLYICNFDGIFVEQSKERSPKSSITNK